MLDWTGEGSAVMLLHRKEQLSHAQKLLSMTYPNFPSQGKPCSGVFWIYGLSGAGKTTLTTWVKSRLSECGVQSLVLDGDVLRNGLCSDLGYTASCRMENVRRAAEVARLISSQGRIVLAAFMTPTREMRRMAKEIVSPIPFFEVYLQCSLHICQGRDVKGLYARSDIKNLPGKDMGFEPPEFPDAQIDTHSLSVSESGNALLDCVLRNLPLCSSKAIQTVSNH